MHCARHWLTHHGGSIPAVTQHTLLHVPEGSLRMGNKESKDRTYTLVLCFKVKNDHNISVKFLHTFTPTDWYSCVISDSLEPDKDVYEDNKHLQMKCRNRPHERLGLQTFLRGRSHSHLDKDFNALHEDLTNHGYTIPARKMVEMQHNTHFSKLPNYWRDF